MPKTMRAITYLLLLSTTLVFGIAPAWHAVFAHPSTGGSKAVTVRQADHHDHDCTICHLATVAPVGVAPATPLPVHYAEGKPIRDNPSDFCLRIVLFRISTRAPPAV